MRGRHVRGTGVECSFWKFGAIVRVEQARSKPRRPLVSECGDVLPAVRRADKARDSVRFFARVFFQVSMRSSPHQSLRLSDRFSRALGKQHRGGHGLDVQLAIFDDTADEATGSCFLADNQRLTEANTSLRECSDALKQRIAEFEDDLVAARTSLRRHS